MPSNNRDVASVWDMAQAIRHIQAFTKGLTFDDYVNNIYLMNPTYLPDCPITLQHRCC